MSKQLWRRVWHVAVVAWLAGAGIGSAQEASVSAVRTGSFTGDVWPGDLNGDGIVDLVGSSRDPSAPSDPRPVVTTMLGRGDGRFAPPVRSGFRGVVYGVGDFNNDGRLDALIQVLPQPDESVLMLAGNGDGTFAPGGHEVTVAFQSLFALSGDFDGDGKRDVALAAVMESGGYGLWLYRGHGDLTFESAGRLETGALPQGGTVADLDDDGRADIVVANHAGRSVSLFVNQGAFGFTASTIPIAGQANGVAVADVTGDGIRDLLVAVSDGGDGRTWFTEGYVDILAGTGDGAFLAAVRYPVEPGAWRVAAGDFNRDGRIDIATANRSSIFLADCAAPLKTWDTLSILTQRLYENTFWPRQSFSIGNQLAINDPISNRNTVSSLVTADLDRDGHRDFVLSSGVVFLSTPTDANWPATVNVGPDATFTTTRHITLHAAASDSDQDMLSYAWSTNAGISIAPVPTPCIDVPAPGTYWFQAVVTDTNGNTTSDVAFYTFTDEGGGLPEPAITVSTPAAGVVVSTAAAYTLRWQVYDPKGRIAETSASLSTDNGLSWMPIDECQHLAMPTPPGSTAIEISCRWDFPGPPTQQALVEVTGTGDGAVTVSGRTGTFTIADARGEPPWPWRHADIGAVGAPGSAIYDGFDFRVKGAGADIWNRADAFQFMYRPNPVHHSTGSGELEIVAEVETLENVAPWTKAGLMLRQTLDPDSPHASVFATPGKGIAFQRRVTTGGESVHTAGPAHATTRTLRLTASPLQICDGRCRTVTVVRAYVAEFSGVWTPIGEQQFDVPPEAFAYVGIAVSSHVAGTTALARLRSLQVRELPPWSVQSIGTASGTATIAGDRITVQARGADIWGTADAFEFAARQDGIVVTAHVASVSNTDPWTKAGVMIRTSLDADAAYAMVMVTPGKGIAMQYRPTRGGASVQVVQVPGTAPAWVQLQKIGSSVYGYYSTDGVSFRVLGAVTVDVTSAPYLGVAMTSHTTAATATTTFDQVAIDR
jgi:hypothetical protein